MSIKNNVARLVAAVVIVSQMSTPISAATVQGWRVKREGQYTGQYAYTDITWTYEKKKGKDGKEKNVITNSSAVQAKSGLMVTINGADRVAKTDSSHKWSCKTGYVLGVQLPIIDIGYVHVWNDYITVFNQKTSKKKPVIDWDN
ncbi:MAG: hypothetical protein K6G88_07415 [Lachnospiraceae bacterium]|nr:hypothetical protein [Lachnospiraceae bacterium]